MPVTRLTDLVAVSPVVEVPTVSSSTGLVSMTALLILYLGNGALDCVAQSNLVCDNNVQERGNTLCRAKTGNGGIIDGTKIIQNLGQAKVN